ncbi:MAG: hypothetical protein ACJ790_02640 [Myxococcaceae bacterium]
MFLDEARIAAVTARDLAEAGGRGISLRISLHRFHRVLAASRVFSVHRNTQ